MAKGSVRKRGKKWYYRFYVENESGNLVQKEYVGTESKSETEKLLRKAMEDYEERKLITKSENITLGMIMDMWIEEEVKPGTLSNGTVMSYQTAARKIKKYPIADRKLKKVTAEHLQQFIDLLSFGGTKADGTIVRAYSKGYLLQIAAVLQGTFRFAVFPKHYITYNPMQYVVLRGKKEDINIFAKDYTEENVKPTITHEQYISILELIRRKDNPAVLPIQIAYYTGLRIGEVCGLFWQDINLEEQYLTVRRSMRYNSTRHKLELGTTKRNKIRTVDFGNTLTEILKMAKKEQHKECVRYGNMYHYNYFRQVNEKGRNYYDVYSMPNTEDIPEDYKEISLVCLRHDGSYESPMTVGSVCRKIQRELPGMEEFHFHMLRHTYTSNLLRSGASPKDVQELLGHSDVSTTMNVYAHASREAKRTYARLLDQMAE